MGVLIGKVVLATSIVSMTPNLQANIFSDLFAWLVAQDSNVCYDDYGDDYNCDDYDRQCMIDDMGMLDCNEICFDESGTKIKCVGETPWIPPDGCDFNEVDEMICEYTGQDCSQYGAEDPVCYWGFAPYDNWCYAEQAEDYDYTWGNCENQGQSCDTYGYYPVCGNDGLTYSNYCYAQETGMTHYDWSYIDYRNPDGTCYAWDWQEPEFCVYTWGEPQCVNGSTYSDYCVAHMGGLFDDGNNTWSYGACSQYDIDAYDQAHEDCAQYRGTMACTSDNYFFASWCDAEAEGNTIYSTGSDCDYLYDFEYGPDSDCRFACDSGRMVCPGDSEYDSSDFSCYEDPHAVCEPYRTGTAVCTPDGMTFDSGCDAEIEGYYDYSEYYCPESCGYTCDGDYACGNDWFDNRDCDEDDTHAECEPYRTGEAVCTEDGTYFDSGCDAELDGYYEYDSEWCGDDCKYDCFGDWVCKGYPTHDDEYCEKQKEEEDEEHWDDEDWLEWWEEEIEHTGEVLVDYDELLAGDMMEAKEDLEDMGDEVWDQYEDFLDMLEDLEEEIEERGDKDHIAELEAMEPYLTAGIEFAEEGVDFFNDVIWPEFYSVHGHMQDLYDEMAFAYNTVVEFGDSEEFWELADSAGYVREVKDLLWWYGEYYSRYPHFLHYLMDAKRFEVHHGLTPEDISEGFAEAVEICEEIVETVPGMHAELLLLVEEAQTALAEGEDADRAYDDARDLWDDIRDMYNDNESDLWDELDEAYEYVKGLEIIEFMENDLEYIKEDIEFVKRELGLIDQGGDKDTTKAWELVEKAEYLVGEMEEAVEDGDYDRLEDLGWELEEIGKAAEHELKKLGLEFHDSTDSYIDSVNVDDVDSLLKFLLEHVSDDLLDAVIDKLMDRIQEDDLNDIAEYTDEFGDIGVDDILQNTWVELEKLDDMIEKKLEQLASLESKIVKLAEQIEVIEEDIGEVAETLAAYNFDDHTDDAITLQDEMHSTLEDMYESGASDDEMKAIMTDYKTAIKDLKDEAKEAKYQNGTIPFKDTDDDQWYTRFVADAVDREIVSGYAGDLVGYYGPGDNVTVAEILKMALKGNGHSEQDGTVLNPYAIEHWAEGYFVTAEEIGLTLVANATRKPDEGATRSEVLRVLFEAGDVDVPETTEEVFSDVSLAHENADYVMYAYELGIVSGDDNADTFRPDDTVNRAEAAKILANFLETLENEELVSEYLTD